MPIHTTIECDKCKKTIGPIKENTPGADEVLQVTDANAEKFFFCGIACLRAWATKYESPYKRPEKADFVPADATIREN